MSSVITSIPPFGGSLRGNGGHVTAFDRSLSERALAKRATDGILTLPQAFKELFTALEPTEAERAKASKQQQSVRECLDDLLNLDPDGPSYLSGSYRRFTLIRPLDDIDVLLVLDHETYAEDDEVDITLDGTGAQTALGLLDDALEDAYPKTEKHPFNRGVQMNFAGTGIGFDIVPVLRFTEHEFWMPDVELGRWIRTNPREVQRLVSAANQGVCDGWLVPLVKLLKAWKDHNKVPLRGFHLEAMAYHALQHVPTNERSGILYLFGAVATAVLSAARDIWPEGEDADVGLTAANRLRAASMLSAAAETARAAITAEEEGRPNDAHALWYSLFGDRYPETGAARAAAKRLSASEALKVVSTGSAFSATSNGLVRVTAGAASVRTSTSHGGEMDEVPITAAPVPADELSPERREFLEGQIALALAQFSDLKRIDPSLAATDPELWPVRPGTEGGLYAVLVGEQGTNYGGRHRILVKIPVDMPATEPRVYMLRQHVERAPRKGGVLGVRFVAKRPIRHQWRDGAMCSHARRDRWDGRLVTALVHAADWLFRQEHYRRTGYWIGHEIDLKGRHLLNGKLVSRAVTRRIAKGRRGVR